MYNSYWNHSINNFCCLVSPQESWNFLLNFIYWSFTIIFAHIVIYFYFSIFIVYYESFRSARLLAFSQVRYYSCVAWIGWVCKLLDVVSNFTDVVFNVWLWLLKATIVEIFQVLRHVNKAILLLMSCQEEEFFSHARAIIIFKVHWSSHHREDIVVQQSKHQVAARNQVIFAWSWFELHLVLAGVEKVSSECFGFWAF